MVANLESYQHSSPEPAKVRDFPNDVNRIVKTLDVDDRLENLDLIYRTDLVEMTNGLRYIVGYNTIEPTKQREMDPANKRYAGSDMVVLEGTAWTTKNGKYYRQRHDMLALEHRRPSIIVGVQQNLNRFNNLHKTTDDMLAIHAFYAAVLGYDQDNMTTMGTSRGGMLALLLQLRAGKYGKNVVHSDSMVPCVPTTKDTVKMFSPKNLYTLVRNEARTAQHLGLSKTELLEMVDVFDFLSVRGLIQQIKEGLALGGSNIERAVAKSSVKDAVGDIVVQRGDAMSYADKWPTIFANHPNMHVDVRDGGGHGSCISKLYFNEVTERQGAVAKVLHTSPEHRKISGPALRTLIDQHHVRNNAA